MSKYGNIRLSFFLLICASTVFAQGLYTQLRVVALDSNDRRVTNLTVADFQIQEQGKQRPIEFFRGSSRDVLEPLAANEFSNRAPSVPRTATMILFDVLNPIDEKLARAQLSPAVTLADDVSRVRLIVYDRNSGATGTLTLPVEHQ